MSRTSTTLLLALLLLGAAPAAARQVTPVIETRVGERPPLMDRHLAALIMDMGRINPLGGEALASLVEQEVSRPSGMNREPAGLRQLVEEGRRQFIEGQYNDAIKQLERARALIRHSASALARDRGLREAQHRALLYLAHAYLRAGQRKLARRSVAEALRSFSDRDLSLARYGPELADFYREVRRELGKLPRRKLTVVTEPPGCMVFLNGDYRGESPVSISNLLAGEYLVHVKHQARRGRVHPVALTDRDRKVRVDLALDQVLSTNQRVALVYPDHAARERRGPGQAAHLARVLGARQAVVVELQSRHGRPALAATLVDAREGRPLRSARVTLEPEADAAAGVRQLARFIAGDRAGDQLQVSVSPLPGGQAPAARTPGPWGPLKWASLGAAVAALGAGAALLAIDGNKACGAPGDVLCPENYDTLGGGIALVAVGAVAAAGAGVFFYLDSGEEEPAPAVALAPWGARSGGGIAAGLTW